MKNKHIKKHLQYISLLLWECMKTVYDFLFSAKQTPPYSGRFMTKLEQLSLLDVDNMGVTVNGSLRLEPERCFRHICVTGSTGSGKSSVIFIPSILSIEQPLFILDCSGSLYDQTSGYLESKGFTIHRLNLSDPLNGSVSYNPMYRANSDSKLKRLAATIVKTALPDSKDPFWNNSARNILYLVMRIIKESCDPKFCNLANVRHILNHLRASPDSVGYKWIMYHANDHAYAEMQGALSGGEKTIDSILATCRTALEVFSDPEISALTAKDTLGDLQSLRRRKTALYLTIQETDISYLNSIVSIILGDILDMCMDTPTEKDLDYYLLLDEFAHFTITDFSTILTTLRKRRVSVTLAIQSRSMLRHKYGRADSDSIMKGGCVSHIYLPGGIDYEANEDISKLCGKHMVQYDGKDMVKPVLSADEIYALKNKAIFQYAGHRPTILPLCPFYKSKTLLHKTRIPPVAFNREPLSTPELLSLEIFELDTAIKKTKPLFFDLPPDNE